MPPPMAPNSTSGLIRKRMGPRIAGLIRHIADARQNLKEKPRVDDQSTNQLADAMEENIAKLETSVEKLETDNQNWLTLIETLTDEAAESEEALYSYWATECEESGKSFVFLLDDASSLIKLLKLKTHRFRRCADTTTDLNTSNNSGPNSNKNHRSPKLKMLELPLFHGDPLLFKEFWALFSAAVDQEDFDPITKFSYLRQQLRSTARDAIAGLEVTDGNYALAVQLLRERFEKTTPEIIGTLYSKLKLMPRCNDHHQSLRKTYDAVQKIVRQLTNMGVEMSSNQLLVMDILAKFPESVIKEITMRKNVDIRSTVEDAEKALEEYIEQAELLSGMVTDLKPFASNTGRFKHPSASEPRKFGYNGQQQNNDKPSFSTRSYDNSSLSTMDNKITPNRECVFCGDTHFHSECPNYPTRKVRQDRIQEVGNCERCLCHGHSKDECRTRKMKIRCFICKATGEHSSPFCPKLTSHASKSREEEVAYHASETTPKNSKHSKIEKQRKPEVQKTQKPEDKATVNALSVEENSILSTARGEISNPITGQRRKVRFIFDNCSHRSYIKQNIATELDLPAETSGPLKVSVFGSEKSVILATDLVEVCVHLRDGSKITVTANSTPTITSCLITPEELPADTRRLLKTMKSALADDLDEPSCAPEFLIGADLFWDFITGSKLKTSDGVYLIPTSLGMVLGGCYKSEQVLDREQPAMLCLTERIAIPGIETALSTISWESRSKIPPDVHDFWSLESIGIMDDPTAKDDEVVMKNFRETVRYKDGRYEVQWPWRDNCNELPANYGLALGRLKSLLKRFQATDGTLAQQYSKIFEEQVAKGIIEVVPDADIGAKTVKHYLAHHAVVKESHLTTKVRIVFDGSARSAKDTPSLNECLMRGPVILPDLCAILLRFRLQHIAIISDIEKAFHQVALEKSQRDAVRFLWLKDASKLQTEGNLQIYRFARVPFGTISSPFLLGATILHHLERCDTPTAKRMSQNMYVDNCITGADTQKEAEQFYKEAKSTFARAGMNLREFCANSDKLMNFIAKEDRCSERVVKVLGIKWDSKADTMQLTKNWNKYSTCKTKREVLKATASIFDPLGWFQPVTIKMKCLIRDLWDVNSDWDDEFPENFIMRWEQLRDDAVPVFNIISPRHIGPLQANSILVTFTDASQDAYAAAVYLRSPVKDGWRTNLLFSKSRIAPKVKWKKCVTIPRLELMGLVIGVRISKFVRQALLVKKPIQVHIFCDSTCVLNWIRSTKTLDRFTTNRVKQIRSIDDATFRYIKSEDNPADLATRGITGPELRNNKLWWHGPQFLNSSVDYWPKKEDVPTITSSKLQLLATMNPRSQIQGPTLFAGEGSRGDAKQTPCGIDVTRSSTLHKLLRITSICLKFLKAKLWIRVSGETSNLHPQIKRIFDTVSCDKAVTAGELAGARYLWVKFTQEDSFSEVREAIEKKARHPLIQQFNLQVDDRGLIRCCGRLSKADLPEETISPILMPKKHYITQLIINEVHHRLMHSGVRHTLSEVRREFWVPQGRQAVQGVINNCLVCKRFKGHEFKLPKMPPLPPERVVRSKPFEFVGLDLIGPINVRINEETKKGWICIFTCLVIRAIHLEWMIDCTTISFLNCLSRFIARRGTPSKVVSDNASQFHLTNDLFRRLWKQVQVDDEVTSYVAKRGIEWNFTTEFAPWQGGVYERLVGVVKNALRAQIGRKLLSFDTFITLLTEVEAVVNTRPVTFLYSDFQSGQALRPQDFLAEMPTGSPSIEPNTKPEGGEASKLLTTHWKEKQRKLAQFWQLWYTEYLLSLRQRDNREHRNRRSASGEAPKIGEVVIVKNTDAPRGAWKLARITKLLHGSNDVVKSAELMLPNRLIIRRPINHLYSLEVPSAPDPAIEEQTSEATSHDDEFDGFDAADVERTAQLQMRFAGNDERTDVASLCAKSKDALLSGLNYVAAHSREMQN